jgi:A/G-specific adenine glycosylase
VNGTTSATMSSVTPALFATLLLAWYDKHGRELPWRAKGRFAKDRRARNPYAILLSEMMLQQTQVPRVLIKWEEWLSRFPTAADVAKASVRDVLLQWEGMGYNNRALRLKACCEQVSEQGWPSAPDALEELPGIGRYTAHAIACFAFAQRVPIVDVNVKLVYAPFVGAGANDDAVWDYAWRALPAERFYDYNQALYDLGTVVKSGDLSTLPAALQEVYAGVLATAGRNAGKKEKRAEKLYGGYPLRLYRGCLVQVLRDAPGHTAGADAIGKAFAEKLSTQPASFVLDVARKLEKDGVVVVKGTTVLLAR